MLEGVGGHLRLGEGGEGRLGLSNFIAKFFATWRIRSGWGSSKAGMGEERPGQSSFAGLHR
jgi:hypothetical protein